MITKEILENELIKFFQANGYDISNAVIEIPKDIENGSFSTNAALKEAKKLGFNNPREFAEKIQADFKLDGITKIEIAGPGFINFYTDDNNNVAILNNIINLNADYGSSNVFADERVNVEYVSANPTGELHLGHARNAVVGSVLANAYRKAGAKVVMEYYINDAGNQIANLGLSLYARYLELLNLPFEMPADGYHGQDIIDIAQIMVDQYGDKFKDDYDADFWKESGVKYQLQRIEKTLNDFNCEIQIWTSEKGLFEDDDYEKNMQLIHDHTYMEDGAEWIATTKLPQYKDDKDRVLVKSDGSFTYLVGDILNHIKKYESEENYTKLINIWGADHHGYFPRVRASMSLLGYNADNLDVVIIQMVQLLVDGQTTKMSKRSGNAVTIRELIDEVGVDATRFLFASREPSAHLDFDIEVAKKQTSDNPIFYIQYANARINSILKKAQAENIDFNAASEYKYNDDEQKIIIMLNELPNVITSVVKKQQPNVLATYLLNVATAFHKYYANNKIIDSNDLDATCGKIKLALAIQVVIKNSLELLGCNCPDEM